MIDLPALCKVLCRGHSFTRAAFFGALSSRCMVSGDIERMAWVSPYQRACHSERPYAELLSQNAPPVLPGLGSPHAVRPLGILKDSACGCQKSSCCALSVTDPREAAGYRYVPDPLDTSKVRLCVRGSGRSSREL